MIEYDSPVLARGEGEGRLLRAAEQLYELGSANGDQSHPRRIGNQVPACSTCLETLWFQVAEGKFSVGQRTLIKNSSPLSMQISSTHDVVTNMKIKVKIITGVHTRRDMRHVSHWRNNEKDPELQPNFICLISSLSYEMIKCANKLCICLVNQRTIAQSVTRWHIECQHCLEEPRSTPLAFSPYSIPVHLPAIACLFYRLKLWNLQNLERMFFLSLYLHREP